MSPHYQRPLDQSMAPGELDAFISHAAVQEDETIDDAAEALREVDVEAVQTDPEPAIYELGDKSTLEEWSIDDLRRLAAELDVPDRAQIVEQDKLIAETRARL